jgi:serine/threonine protein kinase
VEKQIGRGSFAVVWRARHVDTGLLVAIKEIKLEKLNRKLRESLESEISVLQRSKHDNIIKLHEIIKVGLSRAGSATMDPTLLGLERMLGKHRGGSNLFGKRSKYERTNPKAAAAPAPLDDESGSWNLSGHPLYPAQKRSTLCW